MIEPHLWFDDFAEAVGWYRDVLGFEPVTWFPDEGNPTWCQLKRGEQPLMIANTPPPSQSLGNQSFLADVKTRLSGQGAPLSLYLHVEDVDVVHEAAEAADAEIIEPIWDAWWGGRQFTLADPAGTWWTVFQPGEE